MSDPTTGNRQAAPLLGSYEPVRPPSRAERLSHPLTMDAIMALAEKYGVCIRPVAVRRTDLATGQTEVFDLPCGATRESRCVGCARRNKRLRQVQCREGWHRDDEPLPPPKADREQVGMLLLRADFEYARVDCLAKSLWDQVADLDAGIAEVEKLMTASGLRGRIPPNPVPAPRPSTLDACMGGGNVSATDNNTAGAAFAADQFSSAIGAVVVSRCGPSLGSWVGTRRRSAGSCAATVTPMVVRAGRFWPTAWHRSDARARGWAS
jgi:hypothetical protein